MKTSSMVDFAHLVDFVYLVVLVCLVDLVGFVDLVLKYLTNPEMITAVFSGYSRTGVAIQQRGQAGFSRPGIGLGSDR